MKTRSRILFVAAGVVQAEAIRHARELGYYTIAVDADPQAVGLQYADEAYVDDILDPDRIVEIAQKSRTNAILSISTDISVISVAKAQSRLKHRKGLSIAAAEIATNKHLQRQCMEQAGIRVPKYQVLDRAALASSFKLEVDYPIVIKPVDSAGSRGVHYVAEATQLRVALENAITQSRSGRAIIEQFIPGLEYSLEGFVIDHELHVLCFSEKRRTSLPYLLDVEVGFPAQIDESIKNKILTQARAVVVASGLNNCPLHMELILSDNEPWIVEFAARGPGFHVFTKILPRITGIDTVAVTIQLSLGEKPFLRVHETIKAATILFIDPVPGCFRSVDGLDDARNLSGIDEIYIYPHEGDVMKPLKSGSDRVGHIIAYGQTLQKSHETAHAALEKLKIHIMETGNG